MKPRRSALPLPRYVLRKPLRNATWAYFFNVPTWARKAGCPVKNEPLGADHDAAVNVPKHILLPAFDAWRSGGDTMHPTPRWREPARSTGCLPSIAPTAASPSSIRRPSGTMRIGFKLVGNYLLKDSTRLG